MEKRPISEQDGLLPPPRQSRLSRVKGAFNPLPRLLIASFFAAACIVHFQDSLFPWNRHNAPKDVPAKPFSWQDPFTKPYLDYVSCYDDEYQCARLELPMDYWNGTTNATISLAVIKHSAPVPVTHEKYGGAILFNPGGPGGSGISFLRGYRDHIRDILEGHDPEDKYFDLISFDPRGVGRSTPNVVCHNDLEFDGSWEVRMMEEGAFSSSDAAFARIWALMQLRNGVCSFPGDEPDIKKYVSTVSVARDMLELVERHGEWREKEAKRLLGGHESCAHLGNSPVAAESTKPVTESLRYRKGEEKINYLGFSYGSLLGNTFAAMYPDRINRLVVDGVVDAVDYTKALWLDNLVDTEKDMDLFYHHCTRVGWPKCKIANETGTTTEEGVKNRTLSIIENLREHPLVVFSPVPEVIYHSDIKAIVLAVLYSPLELFPLLAELLANMEHGDAGFLGSYGIHRFDCSKCCEYYGKCDTERPRGVALSRDATIGIACTDGDDQSGVTKQEFRKHMDKISKLSPTVGELWAMHRLSCIHYHVRPYHRFRGPWTGNTSFPILEIGNTADPVTPGRYAVKMAKGFPGSVALIQDSGGHCSSSAPSNCTETYTRRYFQKGELPEPGTICPSDLQPFGPGPDEQVVLDATAMKRQERAVGFARAMRASGGGFTRADAFQKISWTV